jgi:hypothetical protein
VNAIDSFQDLFHDFGIMSAEDVCAIADGQGGRDDGGDEALVGCGEKGSGGVRVGEELGEERFAGEADEERESSQEIMAGVLI